ncbi:MAG: hypothetical protein HC880_09820 [Bacteroidia bacterium]|nr:hypothetical protein [Bacteroidia bacterium]
MTLLLSGFGLLAQEKPETLFNRGGKIKISGFGGPILEWSQVDGDLGFMVGGGGAVLLNHFFVGGYGVGLANDLQRDIDGEAMYLDFGHGGLWLGYDFNANKLLHLTLSSKIGWGNLALNEDDGFRNDDFGNDIEDQVFVFTPELAAELNVTRFFKVSVGGGYRLVSNVDLHSFKSRDFASPVGTLTLKFGWFD